MIKKLGDWTVERNFWECLFFYLIYGAAGVFMCGVLTAWSASWLNFTSIEQVKVFSLRVAPLLAGIYTLIVAVLIIAYKRIGKDMLAVLCAIVGTLASMSLGLILGFIPVAFLSCFTPKKIRNS